MRCVTPINTTKYRLKFNNKNVERPDIKTLEWGFEKRNGSNITSNLALNGNELRFSELEIKYSKNKLNYVILFWNKGERIKNFILKTLR